MNKYYIITYQTQQEPHWAPLCVYFPSWLSPIVIRDGVNRGPFYIFQEFTRTPTLEWRYCKHADDACLYSQHCLFNTFHPQHIKSLSKIFREYRVVFRWKIVISLAVCSFASYGKPLDRSSATLPSFDGLQPNTTSVNQWCHSQLTQVTK